jgi:glycogen operon protein
MIRDPDILPGDPFPLGATARDGGVNFCLFSENAERVSLLLFDAPDDEEPARVIELSRRANRTFYYWHCFVPRLERGQIYGWRVHGLHMPRQGLRFDGHKVLLDPYARAVVNTANYDRTQAARHGVNTGTALKAVVDGTEYDWEGDHHLRRPFSQTVIYEMHVGGFTRHPSSGVAPELRGTYRGLIDKIDYLVDLGVTAVELLPVFQFDEQDAPDGLTNYWGYSPISFFAPHAGYSSVGDGLGALDEFRDMVKALHRAGIEVIIDVVYNHTAEVDEHGPTQSFRGIDNLTYYILDDRGRYANYSGCGNTLNANAAVVRRLILDSLRYWVSEMHIDGFRFDLASILSRDETGEPMASPPLLWDIETDPVLAGTKLIAEAWDAAGLYQVGQFFGDHWKEWNGKFRDDMRAFFRGDRGALRRAAPRILASPDLYEHLGGEPERSVNFITSHDGFTLNDLVSYNEKHNEENLEGNRDGDNHNVSWNCGVEGPTDDPEIEWLRRKQIRNMLTVTMISLGIPMLLMGDEVRRTQHGNNNAYCQDNETSWFDWSLVERHDDLHRFVRELIRLRLSLSMYQDNRGLTLRGLLELADVLRWHGVKLDEPDWSEHSSSIAIEIRSPAGIFYVILNAYDEALTFELPAPATEHGWRRLVDTARESPDDIQRWDDADVVDDAFYEVEAHSVVLLSAFITPIDR